MTSERAYVWTWLSGATEPVVAGYAQEEDGITHFVYGRSYLDRDDAIALGPELPLRRGPQFPDEGLTIAGVLRDGSPDGWGRGVIRHGLGLAEGDELTEVQYMLRSGSNRFGALDYQESADQYVPRTDTASLEELLTAAEILEAGGTLSPTLEAALEHGTSIGGARPKATLIADDGTQYLAKFPSSTDRLFSYVNTEATMLALAEKAGIRVPRWRLATVNGKDVLLIERFDRTADGGRRHVLSGLTLARENEMNARYVTYPQLVDVLREYGDPEAGRELFERIAFNMAISNSDDHARNHAAFWDGSSLRLTPAYDLAPGPRSGETATQAMAYGRDGEKQSSFPRLVEHAGVYGLSRRDAQAVVDRVEAVINDHWTDAADLASLNQRDREYLWHRQVLNPAIRYA